MMIGQIAVMKITKIAEGWLSRKPASEIGSQASGGTVRSTWKIGSRPRIAHSALADQRAERDADDAPPAPKPIADPLQRLGSSCQNSALVDAAVVEERIDDQLPGVGQILVGAGSDAPGAEHSICQTKQDQREHDERRRCTAAPSCAAASRSTLDRRPHRRPEGHDLGACAPGIGTGGRRLDARRWQCCLRVAITPAS